MKHMRWLLIATLYVLLAGCSSSSALKVMPENDPLLRLKGDIEAALADSAMQQSDAGIKIVSLKTGETLYERNSERLFHPASNMKLLSTAAALKVLGPTWQFNTDILADSANVGKKQVDGNLYLRGSGDPDLLTDDLSDLAAKLAKRGIARIKGDIICDESYLDDLYWGKGWMWDDVSAWYWAPISALSVNDNCVELTVEPAEKVGGALNYRLEPETAYMQVNNTGLTVSGSDTAAVDSFKVLRRWRPAENIIDVSGGRTTGHRSRTWTIDVVDAPLYVGTLLKEILTKKGIVVDGNVRIGKTGNSAMLLARHTSETLAVSIINTNKESDNLSAELLLKIAGAEAQGVPGTAEKGISQIYRILAEAGIDSMSYYLADGSGVSRYNTVTSDVLIGVLKTMHDDFSVAAEFKASLPIAGKDGTLDYRMQDSPAEGNLRAKTGSLRGVSSLAGYTVTADGEELAFSILMEHFVVRTSKIRAVQDKIGAIMSSFSRQQAAGSRQ